MNADTLQLISIIAFSVATVLALVSAYLFFKMDVKGIIDDLTGKSAERQIQSMREENNRQKNPLSGKNTVKSSKQKETLAGKTTARLKCNEKTEILSKADSEATMVLGVEETTSFHTCEEETTILDENSTCVLQGEDEETTVLNKRDSYNNLNYVMILDEMIIHTRERI